MNKDHDPVNSPKHYTSDPSGVECIDVTRHRNFNIGNAIKYLWRAGLKDSEPQVQDLKKAIWYINDEIKRLDNIRADEILNKKGSDKLCTDCGKPNNALLYKHRSIGRLFLCENCIGYYNPQDVELVK